MATCPCTLERDSYHREQESRVKTQQIPLGSFSAGGKWPFRLSQSLHPHEKLGSVIWLGGISEKQLPSEELPWKWVHFCCPEKAMWRGDLV